MEGSVEQSRLEKSAAGHSGQEKERGGEQHSRGCSTLSQPPSPCPVLNSCFEQFVSLVYDGLLLDGKLSEYEEAFRAVDRSGNGTVGAMEIAQLLRSLGQEVSFEKLAALMEKYDKDESGQVGGLRPS
jgi:hypothetical protein